ncbi:MAG: fumarylacetoacetate hydrolase family protein, partial [Pseudomonadota bacterium]
MTKPAADLFAPPEIPRLTILGRDELFPVRRIFCVGRNYAAHAAEMGAEVDREAPFYFTKGHHAVAPSASVIAYPPGTQEYHFEFELVVALASDGFRVPVESAGALIFGYGAGLDMTRRDLQQANRVKGRPWDTGKDVEQSCVLTGLTPASDFTLASQRIMLKVNDETRQEAVL